MSCEQLTDHLEAQGYSVSLNDIAALFAHYGIDKKKLNMRL
jgi:hypothetical protein